MWGLYRSSYIYAVVFGGLAYWEWGTAPIALMAALAGGMLAMIWEDGYAMRRDLKDYVNASVPDLSLMEH